MCLHISRRRALLFPSDAHPCALSLSLMRVCLKGIGSHTNDLYGLAKADLSPCPFIKGTCLTLQSMIAALPLDPIPSN